MITLELLSHKNEEELLKLDRGDIPDKYVEHVEYTINMSHYGIENGLDGFCTAIKNDDKYIGIILVGEAIWGDMDPIEVKNRNPFRILGFMIDKKYRGQGIGRHAFKMILNKFYLEYGDKPLLLECYKENKIAKKFYEKFGFIDTGISTATDIVMLKNS